MEEWLTSYDAAEISGYNPDYIRQLIRSKKVLGRKSGHTWQVNRQSLKAYLAAAAKQGERRGPKPRPDSNRRRERLNGFYQGDFIFPAGRKWDPPIHWEKPGRRLYPIEQ